MRVLSYTCAVLIFSFVNYLECQETDTETTATKPQRSQDDADSEEDGKPDEAEFQLSDDDLRQAHASIDINGDKEATKQELLNFVDKHETEAALAEMDIEGEIKRKDNSGDGRISLEEHLNDTLKGYELAANDNKNVDEQLRAEALKSLQTAREDETELFKAADANNDGVLDKDELPALMSPGTHQKVLDVVVKTSIRDADADKNGKLSLEEFRESGLSDAAKDDGDENPVKDSDEAENSDDKEVKTLFNRLDANNDGFVDPGELRALESGKIHQEDVVNNFVKDLDKDGDKFIDSDELVQGKGSVRDSELQEYLIAWARKRPVVR